MNDRAPRPPNDGDEDGDRSEQNRARHLKVPAERAGQRIDNFLAGQLKGVPKSHLYKLLRSGQVRVNGGRIRPSHRLQDEDDIRLPPVSTVSRAPLRANPELARRIDRAMVHRGPDIIVIDKPAGLAVHGGSGLTTDLGQALLALRSEFGELLLGHRLDRDTSGCLLLARNRPTLLAFHEALRQGHIRRRYLALTRGGWGAATVEVEAPLARKGPRSAFRRVAIDDRGKESRTLFRPLWDDGQAALVEIELKTGRMHQVRVHAVAAGHPLAGDDRYGDRSFCIQGLKRQFLHAYSLDWPERRLRARAPLPESLKKVLGNLDERLLDAPEISPFVV